MVSFSESTTGCIINYFKCVTFAWCKFSFTCTSEVAKLYSFSSGSTCSKEIIPNSSFCWILCKKAESLPTLSSLMSKSFKPQISPGKGKESSELKEGSAVSVLDSPIAEEVDGVEDDEFIARDLFKWRWHGDQQSSLLSSDGDHPLNHQDMWKHNFLEVGAAALLLGDAEAKMKGEFWGNFGSIDMPYMLQPSLLTTVTNSASTRVHLRAITASRHSKTSPHQIWEDSSLTTFSPHPRPLFQY